MENKIIFYWNNKPDEEYHTHMWTNRICTEKLLKENINKETHIFFITSPKDNDDVFEVIDSVVGKNYKFQINNYLNFSFFKDFSELHGPILDSSTAKKRKFSFFRMVMFL